MITKKNYIASIIMCFNNATVLLNQLRSYFRTDADEDLENLAKISGGQTFFIPDGKYDIQQNRVFIFAKIC